MEITTTPIRFNFDANTIREATEYIQNRAKQLLRLGYLLVGTTTTEEGVVLSYFKKDNQIYQSLYILKDYRGKGLFLKHKFRIYPVLTSVECGIADYLVKNDINHVVESLEPFAEYKLISNYYGSQTTKRTGAYLMNHIDEGLAILAWIGASDTARKAYCMHPVYQSDTDLKDNHWKYKLHEYVMIAVMEYRSVANEYLSKRTITSLDEIRLSPLKYVNDMLIADKIQNRKDFELYHKDTHPRSKELTEYFSNWLTKLGVSEETYQEYKAKLSNGKV